MRFLLIGLVALLCTSCAPQPVIVQPPAQPAPVQPAPVQPQPQPAPPVVPHSLSWMRGYNDGYTGNWLAPGSWLVANEYRAGWSAGERDRLEGKPHRFQ